MIIPYMGRITAAAAVCALFAGLLAYHYRHEAIEAETALQRVTAEFTELSRQYELLQAENTAINIVVGAGESVKAKARVKSNEDHKDYHTAVGGPVRLSPARADVLRRASQGANQSAADYSRTLDHPDTGTSVPARR